MHRNVETITISLPKELSQRLRKQQKREGKTMSEYIRWMILSYQRREEPQKLDDRAWKRLKQDLKRLRSSGKQISLSDFVIKDRLNH